MKMKGLCWLITPLIIVLFLSGCFPTGLPVFSTSTGTSLPLPTSIQSTSTPTSYSTATATITPPLTSSPSPTQTETATQAPSQEPELARNTIEQLLRNPGECAVPCFLGIMPGQSTLSETKTILSQLGLGLEGPESVNNSLLFGTSIKLDGGLLVLMSLTVSDEIVTDMEIKIGPEKQRAGVQREWLAYSPETIIQRYGTPSKVELFLGRGPTTPFDMVIYFEDVDLIIDYYISDLGPSTRICPLQDQFSSVIIWMGKNPSHPPLTGEPLEKTTDLTLEEFSRLMAGNPDEACFKLKVDMFP